MSAAEVVELDEASEHDEEEEVLETTPSKKRKLEDVENSSDEGENPFPPGTVKHALYAVSPHLSLLSSGSASKISDSDENLAQDPCDPQQSECLQKMAEVLLSCEIRVGKTSFELVEVETYFVSDRHRDCFTHCTGEQRKFGSWYFHRASDKEGAPFRSGTYKGLDVSIGHPDTDSIGGILIRSLRQRPTSSSWGSGTLVEGPCRCVDALLDASGCKDLNSLVALDNFRSDVDEPGALQLVHRPDAKLSSPPIRSPRVGILLFSKGRCPSATKVSSAHVRVIKEAFVMRRYRFIRPEDAAAIKKCKHFIHVAEYLDAAQGIVRGAASKAKRQRTLDGKPPKPTLPKGAEAPVAAFEQGKGQAVSQFWDAPMTSGPAQCELFGACYAKQKGLL